MESPLLVRPTEAARRLSLSRSLVYRLLAKGEFRTIRVGAVRLIPVEELSAWVERKKLEEVADAS